MDLAVGHNGVGRFVRLWPAGRTARADETAARGRASVAPTAGPAEGYPRLFVRAPVGPLRLGDGRLAAQAEWLLPLALVRAGGLCRWRPPPPLPPPELG